MLTSLIQSIRYLGHLYPLAVFRIYLGLMFLWQALERQNTGFLEQPQLSSQIQATITHTHPPFWLANWYEHFVIPQWQLFSYIIFFCELVIGLSYLLGFGIRPISILAILLCSQLHYITLSSGISGYQILAVAFFIMAWMGSGRCLGLDYYFFKRIRGIWW